MLSPHALSNLICTIILLLLYHHSPVYIGVEAFDAVPSVQSNSIGASSSPPVGPLPDPPSNFKSDENNNDKIIEDGARMSCINQEGKASESSLPPSSPSSSQQAVPTGKVYCPGDQYINQNYSIWGDDCFEDHPPVMTSMAGRDFVIPQLNPYRIAPITWRSSGKILAQHAFRIGIPSELISTLLDYCNQLKMMELFQQYLSSTSRQLNDNGQGEGFVNFSDGTTWYAQRRRPETPKEDNYIQSNMHDISPANEKTHESYLRALANGGFDKVLDAIGDELYMDSLVVYQMSFMAVSHVSERGFDKHYASTQTTSGVYNVIIPLLLEDGDDGINPELILWDDDTSTVKESQAGGLYKYELGEGIMMGDDAMYGTNACDYRNLTNAKHGGFVVEEEDNKCRRTGMRLVASIYIAEVYQQNVEPVANTISLAQKVFPLPNEDWLLAQEARHWQANGAHYVGNSMSNDTGRRKFRVNDELDDCADRADNGMCNSDIKGTRRKCLLSCNVFIEDEDDDEFVFSFEEYSYFQYIDAFFDNLDKDDDDACIDESTECEEIVSTSSLCMTDSDRMKELGCNKSCMYCLSSSSRALFSLGVDQVMEAEEHNPGDQEGSKLPSQSDVAEVMARSEKYFINEVFPDQDFDIWRKACQNFHEMCAYWAAEGYCEEGGGYMGKYCPAACMQCPMVDLRVRCPTSKELNVFKPGSMNAMFERWLDEAGQDTSSFSKRNIPTGGTHPVGELTVVSSPYHDRSHYIEYDYEEEDDAEEELPPMPWVIAIDGFLTDKECDRLIELVKEYGEDTNDEGSANHEGSDMTTFISTSCQEECDDDPIVRRVIERMTKLTGIPYDNYEYLELVRYEQGQYDQQHHDLSYFQENNPSGPRILTIFLYLNDVERGGGTEFEYLGGFIAEPKRGSALVWPSLVDTLDGIEDLTWYEALKVEKGCKYGVNSLIRLRDFRNRPDPDYC